MSSEKKKKVSKAPRKPFAPLYLLAVICCRAYMYIVYNLHLDNSQLKGINSPAVVLGNHESNLDFIIMALTLYPIRLNFMVTTYFFRHALLGRLLSFMGCIPKKQFVPDTTAIRACLATAKNGQSLGIFPEGQVTYTGATGEIDKSISKLVKKLGLPVIICSIRGDHLTGPKWANGKQYHGRIESTAVRLLSSEQLSELSADEIFNKISAALSYNEYEWQREKHVEFRPKRTTDGLQSILYHCPRCNCDFTFSSKNNELICGKCGYKVEIDSFGFLHGANGCQTFFDNPVDWYNSELDLLKSEMQRSDYSFTSACTLFKTVDNKFGYYRCGSGIMTANLSGIHFKGEKEGVPFEFSALVEHQSNVTHNMGMGGLDVPQGDVNYGLAPDDIRKLIKFVSIYVIAHRIYTSTNHLS
ncbi:MAG: 1-acyl-sn-glycerol-3-phosphate acyltransferase [Oscillospiraceae bacterium]